MSATHPINRFERNSTAWLVAIVALSVLYVLLRNSGLLPVVLPDEWHYSSLARHARPSQGQDPGYLYLALFRLSNGCGPGFLDCARAINIAFYALSLPLIYRVARTVVSQPVALIITGLSAVLPANTFTAYFMPEAMYGFGFWLLCAHTLTGSRSSPLRYGSIAGAIVGLLSMVKPHAWFLLPGLIVFLVLDSLANRREPGWVRHAAKVVLPTALVALGARLAIGGLIAGPSGLPLFGSRYGAIASGAAQQTDVVTRALQIAEILSNHVLALSVVFALPLATLVLARLQTNNAPDALALAQARLCRFAACILLPMLVVVAAFTVSVLGHGPYETNARLHTRYYEFMFPVLLMLCGGALRTAAREPRRLVGAVTWMLIAMTAICILGPRVQPSLIDNPLISGIWPHKDWIAAAGIVTLALWAAGSRWGGRLYLFALVPLVVLAAARHTNRELQFRRTADDYDRAASFARASLSPAAIGRTVVVGDNVPALFRIQFELDAPGLALQPLPTGTVIDTNLLPDSAEWLLTIGTYRYARPLARELSLGSFSLAYIGKRITLDFRQPLNPLLVSSATGLSGTEPWGRWSDGDTVTIRFKDALPPRLKLELTANAFGPNTASAFQLDAGASSQPLVLSAQPATHTLTLETGDQARELTIRVPHPSSPQALGVGNDDRLLGIGIIQLTITPDPI